MTTRQTVHACARGLVLAVIGGWSLAASAQQKAPQPDDLDVTMQIIVDPDAKLPDEVVRRIPLPRSAATNTAPGTKPGKVDNTKAPDALKEPIAGATDNKDSKDAPKDANDARPSANARDARDPERGPDPRDNNRPGPPESREPRDPDRGPESRDSREPPERTQESRDLGREAADNARERARDADQRREEARDAADDRGKGKDKDDKDKDKDREPRRP